MSNTSDRVRDLRHEIQAVRDILKQIPADALTEDSPIEGYGTIGEHFRHIINFIENLIDHYPDGHIDFENRQPNEAFEINKEVIDNRLDELSRGLDIFLIADSGQSLTKTFKGAASGKTHIDKTTLGAIINDVTSHTNHHIPTIRFAALSSGVKTKSNAGIAAGTLERQN